MMSSLQHLRSLLHSAAVTEAKLLPVISTGIDALDQLLPEHGLKPGSLLEWLSAPAAGSATLAFCGLAEQLANDRTWCVIDPQHAFCPSPALEFCEEKKPLVIRPRTWTDVCWTVEQTLRCPAVAVTWLWAEDVPERVLRRWKLAAEQGGGLGVLFRPLTAERQPSWSDVRWRVLPKASRCPSTPAASEQPGCWSGSPRRRWRVELAYCRGGFAQGRADLEQDHATGRVHLAAELAHPVASAVGA